MDGGGAGGLLLLGVGVMLLLMYVTGRLDWLFALGADANALRTGAGAGAGRGAPPAVGDRAPSLPSTRVPGAGTPARP